MKLCSFFELIISFCSKLTVKIESFSKCQEQCYFNEIYYKPVNKSSLLGKMIWPRSGKNTNGIFSSVKPLTNGISEHSLMLSTQIPRSSLYVLKCFKHLHLQVFVENDLYASVSSNTSAVPPNIIHMSCSHGAVSRNKLNYIS